MDKEKKENVKESEEVDVDNQVDRMRYKLYYEDRQGDDAVRVAESRYD